VGAAFSTTIDKLNTVRTTVRHKHLIICVDWPPYWRVQRCSEYKAQRAAPSEFATAQFRRVRDHLKNSGHTLCGVKGYEADDIIATVCAQAQKLRQSVVIATGDKDLMQLVDDTCSLYETRTGLMFGAEQVREKYGVQPSLVRDLLTLTGDTSDNIPGVRGVGTKKAAQLIESFGNWRVAVAAAHADDPRITKALAQSLREHEDFELAWELVGLRDNAPVDLGALLSASRGQPQEQEKKEAISESAPMKTPIKKMTLENVSRGRKQEPFDLILYGPEGTGKSTFASEAPSPIFFDLESGTGELDVARMPQPESWKDMVSGFEALKTEPHEFKTVVVDTIDALETLIQKHVCETAGVKEIEDIPYGAGYKLALALWRDLGTHLLELRSRGMNTILLGHSQVRKFSNPRGEDYDRFQFQLNEKAAAILKNQSKNVLFVTYDEAIKNDPKNKSGKPKAFGDGSRVVFTEYRPAFDAKNRHGLPFELALNWSEFEAAARAGAPAPIGDVIAELDALKTQLSEKHQTELEAAISRTNDDVRKLSMLVDWARSKANTEGKAA
jgi:5'-3' exonuclease